jgi:hypothetical protein
MSEPRCRDCRFWSQSVGPRFDDDPNVGVASAIGGDGTWGYCLATIDGSAEGHDGTPANPLGEAARALVADTEGWLGVLTTREDFGCVQWAVRAPADGGRDG